MYVEKIFTDNEEIKEVAKLHWIRGVPTFVCFLFGILSLVYGIGILFIIFGFYFYLSNKTTEMVVTNKRVVSKVGIVAVHLGELRNIKVESVRLHQGILDRMLGCGDIEFTGTGTTAVVFKDVDNPAQTMSRIKEIIDKTKNEI